MKAFLVEIHHVHDLNFISNTVIIWVLQKHPDGCGFVLEYCQESSNVCFLSRVSMLTHYVCFYGTVVCH